MQQPQAPRQLRLEAPNNLNAIYSNAVVVTHTASSEIVFDFVQVMPNDPRARIQTRVVMTPISAKMFLNALGENLRRYEQAYGDIQLPPSLADQLFGGIKPPDDPPVPEQPESA